MYPNDNRYPDNMSNMDSMNPPMYGNQMRPPSMDMNNNRPLPLYYDPPYYDKNPPMMQPPIYDYMNQPPMMPMNQTIDPRYTNWREPSENRPSMMPYYDRPPISQPYMHSKPSLSPMPYNDSYPTHEHMQSNVRGPAPAQMNVLQKISFLIKSQLPQLKKVMSKVSATTSSKKKEPSRRERSRQREKERNRSRSHEKQRKLSNSTGEWVCSKCSFLNFDWRDKCKKCSDLKPSFPSKHNNFVPGPEDWKCFKCGNLNYARRLQCNRCKQPKSSNR